jgi:hypothetical protein
MRAEGKATDNIDYPHLSCAEIDAAWVGGVALRDDPQLKRNREILELRESNS